MGQSASVTEQQLVTLGSIDGFVRWFNGLTPWDYQRVKKNMLISRIVCTLSDWLTEIDSKDFKRLLKVVPTLTIPEQCECIHIQHTCVDGKDNVTLSVFVDINTGEEIEVNLTYQQFIRIMAKTSAKAIEFMPEDLCKRRMYLRSDECCICWNVHHMIDHAGCEKHPICTECYKTLSEHGRSGCPKCRQNMLNM